MTAPLDTLARTLGATTSRREALRAFGAFAATSALTFAGLGFGSLDPGRSQPGPSTSRAAGTCGPPSGTGLPEFCSDNGHCLCMSTPESDRACMEFPFGSLCDETPACSTNDDCAALGGAYVCAYPGDGFCDDNQGRCLVPCGTTDWSGTWTGTSALGSERVDVRFVVTDVDDSLRGRLFVADPVSGEWVDLGPFSGAHLGGWASWTADTGLGVSGEFVGDAFTGTLRFPEVRGHAAFAASVVLTKSAPVGSEPVPGTSDPKRVEMLAPYPNPARSGYAVTIPLRVSEAGPVRVAVYDALGRELVVLHDGPVSAGDLRLPMSASLAPGTYAVRATSGTAVATRTLTIAR